MNVHARCCCVALLLASVAPFPTLAGDGIKVTCIDAMSGAALGCKADVTSPEAVYRWSQPNPDRLPPPVRVVLTHEGYLTRTIDLSAAFLNRSTAANFSMVKRLPQGQVPTLGTIAQFDRFVKRGEFDRALSIVELLNEHGPSARSVGTFHVRHMYARHVAYFKACTVLFYIACPLAQTTTTELREDILGNPSDYSYEHVSSKGLEIYIEDASVAAFNELYARANWFQQRNEYTLARAMYEDARRALSQLPPNIRSRTGMTEKQLNEDIAFMQTRDKASRGKAGTAPAGPEQPQATPSMPAEESVPTPDQMDKTSET